MIASTNIPLMLRRFIVNPMAMITAAFLCLALVGLKGYLVFDSMPCILGLLTLIFVMHWHHKGKRSARFGYMAFAFLLLGALLPVHTILFLSIAFSLLFLLEYYYGRIGFLPVLILALMSPAFQYLIDVFSFPIRLKLTAVAGALFNAAGISSTVKGNVIVQGATEYSVDPGCMGLNMMQASLLLAIMLIVFYGQQYRRSIRGLSMVFYFALIVLLNILANLFRIIILVNFNIPAGSFFHEATGVACLLIYVFMPSVYLTKFVVRRAGSVMALVPGSIQLTSKGLFFPVLLLAGAVILTIYVMHADTYKKVDLSAIKMNREFVATIYAPGILKLEQSKALIYVKYIRSFYDTDHNPMICWKGSGYVFEQVQEEKFNNGNIYTGILTNDGDKLYSAWWYSDGEKMITDQWTWRWDMIKGKQPYALVNITCPNKNDLEEELRKIRDTKMLLPLFNHSVYH